MKNRNILISAAVVAALVILFLFLKDREERPRLRYAAKKHAFGLSAQKRPADAMPLIAGKRSREVRVAIVMDDFGNNKNNFDLFLTIKEPITLSVLPELRYSAEIAYIARAHGREVMLHLPLEAHNKEVKEELDTIRVGMSEKDVMTRLSREIASVPGIDGVSNHMGSRATEDKDLMTVIFKDLKKRGLYFFDSMTSESSVCGEAARSAGIRYAKRDIFLDNSNEPGAIEAQVLSFKKIALKRGRAIAVCHDRKNTVTVLARMLPEMTREGIKVVKLSEMVK